MRMTGDFPSVNAPKSLAGEEFMGLMRSLSRVEILELLSDGKAFCQHCQPLLLTRVRKVIDNRKSHELSESSDNKKGRVDFQFATSSSSLLLEENSKPSTKTTSWSSIQPPVSIYSEVRKGFTSSSPASIHRKRSYHHSTETTPSHGRGGVRSLVRNGLSEEQECARFAKIRRKKDFAHIETNRGKVINVLQGLELHTGVFNAEEQKEIVDCVYNFQRKGQNGRLRARTYSEPRKWMRGKGRVTIQFGCCYNYAVDKKGNPPGIVRDEKVDPLPPLFEQMIERMVRWHILPPTCVPNSCIVNIYEAGDCIPPHIDHHDFVRPFCTVSFLTECNIIFGANLKIVDAGEFSGPVSIPLPVGSVLVLSGNGADVAKHCVPGVPAKRISITFRKMDNTKQPYRFSSNPELARIKPLEYSPLMKLPPQKRKQPEDKSFFYEKDDFLEPGSSSFVKKQRGEQKWSEANKILHRKLVRFSVATETSNKSSFYEKDDFPEPGSSSFVEKQK